MDNIEAKTGKNREDFKKLAAEKGFFKNDEIVSGVKATTITDWLKKEFGPGMDTLWRSMPC